LAIILTLNHKRIWDNTEFENILFSDLKYKPSSFLPPKRIDDEVVIIGGWKIDVKSTVDKHATSDDIVKGYDKLSTKLRLNAQRSFVPFISADISDYDPRKEVQKSRAVYEPLVVMFLRLCYWYYKCDGITPTLERKNKEIRNKLKVSNSLMNIIKSRGFDSKLPKEWVRQAIGVIYELICASLSYDYHQLVSFEKRHEFIFEKTPAEVKTKFPPLEARLGEEFYPFLNASLKKQDIDLLNVLRQAIKVPEIMENNVKPAIERQKGEIIFLNLIVETGSTILRFLSEYKRVDLSFQNSINEATKLIFNESNLPLILCFHAVHCEYEIYALTIPIPIRKKNGKTTIDMSKM
jgi:hypothetical protein